MEDTPPVDANANLVMQIRYLQGKIAEDIAKDGKLSENTIEYIELKPEEHIGMLRILVVFNMTMTWRETEISSVAKMLISYIQKDHPSMAALLLRYPAKLKSLAAKQCELADPEHKDQDIATFTDVMQTLACDTARTNLGVFQKMREANDRVKEENVTDRHDFYEALLPVLAEKLSLIKGKPLMRGSEVYKELTDLRREFKKVPVDKTNHQFRQVWDDITFIVQNAK